LAFSTFSVAYVPQQAGIGAIRHGFEEGGADHLATLQETSQNFVEQTSNARCARSELLT
jgi:hypothetical protein